MRNEYSAMVFRDDGWYVALSQDAPNAHGQGRTAEAALEDLRGCIKELQAYERAQFRKLTRQITPRERITATLQLA